MDVDTHQERLAASIMASLKGANRGVVRRAMQGGSATIASPAATDAAVSEIRRFKAAGIDVVVTGDRNYPLLLQHVPDPPLLLFLRGGSLDDSRRYVAIVGSRRASRGGMEFARACGHALASRGITVVSGLATGIDSAAHLGALEAGGKTIAVFGCGLNHVYPAHNRALAERIVRVGGTLISEYEPGTKPRRHHFPERNRIISGLSEAVLVVEASLRSGSLVTARMALEQGRDVFAVPGSIDSDQHLGCHRLIRDGAALVDSVEVLLQELGIVLDDATGTPGASELQKKVLSMLDGMQAQTLGTLADMLEQPIEALVVPLMELEIAGWVVSVDGGYVRTRGLR